MAVGRLRGRRGQIDPPIRRARGSGRGVRRPLRKEHGGKNSDPNYPCPGCHPQQRIRSDNSIAGSLHYCGRGKEVVLRIASSKRLTWLTYAFSKKWENLQSALALHFAYYNFVRIHSALRVTPAMAAGVTDRTWTLEDLIAA